MLRLSLITGAVLTALLATGAKAADMPVYYEEPSFGGWYLRGDVGATHQGVDEVTNEIYSDFEGWTSFEDDFDASWFIGIGFGYDFNEWFRMDVTGEYRGPSDFYGLHGFTDDGDDSDFELLDEYTGEKTEWTFLLNGYWDFYTWEKATFFVGAGVGASYNKISDLVDMNPNSPDLDGGPNCTTGNGCAGDNGEWQFAWAIHAGMAFAITPNMAIEIAYRYLHLGDAETDDLMGNSSNPNADNPMVFDDLDSHDIKLGFRYTFN